MSRFLEICIQIVLEIIVLTLGYMSIIFTLGSWMSVIALVLTCLGYHHIQGIFEDDTDDTEYGTTIY